MLHDAFTSGALMNGSYWWYLPPIVCISGTILCLTLVGERLEPGNNRGGQTLWMGRPAERQRIVHGEGRGDKSSAVLHVRDLVVDLRGPEGTTIRAIDRLNLSLAKGQCLAVIGQTGSGKSVLLMTLMGLLPRHTRVTGRSDSGGRTFYPFPKRDFVGFGAVKSPMFHKPAGAPSIPS